MELQEAALILNVRSEGKETSCLLYSVCPLSGEKRSRMTGRGKTMTVGQDEFQATTDRNEGQVMEIEMSAMASERSALSFSFSC